MACGIHIGIISILFRDFLMLKLASMAGVAGLVGSVREGSVAGAWEYT